MGRNGKLAPRGRAGEVEEEISIGNHDSLRNLKRGTDMGFGMITSGRALWSRGGKSIMPKFFSSLSKLLPAWLLVYSQVLYSCTIILICVCVNALEAKFSKGF